MSDRTLTDTVPGVPGVPGVATALVEAHGALHGALESALYDVMTRLLDGDLAEARATLAHVERVMSAHQVFEEEHVLPAYAPLAPKDGPGRADHVAGDHVILARALAAAHAALDTLAIGGTSRAVLEQLPPLQRVIATLEHHTLREERVYGSLTEPTLVARAHAHVREMREQISVR